MAFPNSLRYPNGMRSPDADNSFASMMSKRDSYSNTPTAASDIRASLQRRFTTDSSKLPLGRTSFSSQPYSSLNSAALEQKQIFEDIQIARRKAHEQLALLDEKERKLQLTNGSSTPSANTATPKGQPDIDHFAGNFSRMSVNGPVSEPTTPPDYSEDVFSNRYSRSSRVSMSNITSPPGLSKRTSIASSKITSPPGNRTSNSALYSSHRQSTKSMPGSRRGSDEEEDYLDTLPTNRSAAALNRFSMPVNTSRNPQTTNIRASHPGVIYDEQDALYSTYSALTGDEESFPTLRSDGTRLNYADEQIANAALMEDESYLYGSRPRPGHASMPHNDSSLYRQGVNGLSSPLERPAEPTRRKSQRYSAGVTFSSDVPPVPTTAQATSRPSALQPSYSMNDVPTVKNTFNRDQNGAPQNDTHFHQHNVSMGRIPPGAVQTRQSREISSAGNGAQYKPDEKTLAQVSALQANAAPFAAGFGADLSALPQPGVSAPYQYSMNTYDMNNFNAASAISPTAAYSSMSISQQMGRQDARNGKRNQDLGRLENAPFESFADHLYEMSKDQHGCRFMQRKLEDGNAAHVQMIFAETCPHIIELMTDPFGNYLCQKLFEHCDDPQRTALINTAAPALPAIALNQHGTRALQKMIEFVRTDEQVETIIAALSGEVVPLVQDLNGNHVIQKCLQVLGAERCQFIYDSVGYNCVAVGTHRHGCCVLQRCIDHAKGEQRAQLVAQITGCAFQLVQDAYGNYVVQYILDIDEVNYTRPLCLSFKGKIVPLSKQKFSSNVIEKCIRVADPATKAEMITEMLIGNELEKMLRDSFANYVVQTALDYGDPVSKNRIMDVIMPILPAIKQTPHGRRIASKIQTMKTQQQAPADTAFVGGRSNNRRQIQINGGGFVYGGHGFPAVNFPANEYASGEPTTTNPIGYTQTAFTHNFNPPGSMGNYI